jgi:hypothetical protein
VTPLASRGSGVVACLWYAGKWVAILESEQKVVGSGNDAYEAKVDAERKGYADTALF